MKNLINFKGKKFHFIGIGGISMSSLALMLKHNGFIVQGSDETENDEVKKLRKKGLEIFIGHNENNINGADIVVYTSAISVDNPELVYAKNSGLIILKRAELLGIVAGLYKTVISVAGSHGKTTATGMIAEIFINAGLKPTVHLGGELRSIKSNVKIGNKKFFITENCEYMDNFLYIKPDISVILNIDSDHLDYFGTLEGVKSSFYKFANQTKDGGINIVYGEDENSLEIKKLCNCGSFGYDKNNNVYAKRVVEYKSGYFSFDAYFEKCKLGEIKLNILGRHNIQNALAAIFVAIICGINFEIIKNSLENFSGTVRRCQEIGVINGSKIFHDYAHHPKQIESMIEVARSIVSKKSGRVIVVFEPHTYSRTKYLLSGFVDALLKADKIILSPAYAARENREEGLDSFSILEEIKKKNCDCKILFFYQEICDYIFEISRPGDVVMILGAGTIEKLANLIKKRCYDKHNT